MSGGAVRVLVCGGRNFADRNLLWRTLNALAEADNHGMPTRHIVIIHGGARGADELADRWATSAFICPEAFPADWTAHGPAAGPIRNARMLVEGRPDLVVAFPGGRGTADMVRKAKAAGIEVREIRP